MNRSCSRRLTLLLRLSLAVFSLTTFVASAQTWQSVGGDYVGVHRNDDVIVAAGRNGAILRSTDDGATWTNPSSGTWHDLRFVGLAGAGIGWVLGANGAALVTTDGGATWSRMTTPPYSAVDAFSVAGASSALAIVDSNRILRTTDAGTNWSELGRFPGTQALSLSMRSMPASV